MFRVRRDDGQIEFIDNHLYEGPVSKLPLHVVALFGITSGGKSTACRFLSCSMGVPTDFPSSTILGQCWPDFYTFGNARMERTCLLFVTAPSVKTFLEASFARAFSPVLGKRFGTWLSSGCYEGSPSKASFLKASSISQKLSYSDNHKSVSTLIVT